MKLSHVAIIAHVDHGKTTLVDRLLQQSGTYRTTQRVSAPTSNTQERERGITFSPGGVGAVEGHPHQHLDTRASRFRGEVERILNMVDRRVGAGGCRRGPVAPRQNSWLSKALKVGLKRSSLFNQGGPSRRAPTRSFTRCSICSGADARRAVDFPILYGWPSRAGCGKADGPKDAACSRYSTLILRHVAPPTVEDGPFRMIAPILEANPYLGRIITGRITSAPSSPTRPSRCWAATAS